MHSKKNVYHKNYTALWLITDNLNLHINQIKSKSKYLVRSLDNLLFIWLTESTSVSGTQETDTVLGPLGREEEARECED